LALGEVRSGRSLEDGIFGECNLPSEACRPFLHLLLLAYDPERSIVQHKQVFAIAIAIEGNPSILAWLRTSEARTGIHDLDESMPLKMVEAVDSCIGKAAVNVGWSAKPLRLQKRLEDNSAIND